MVTKETKFPGATYRYQVVQVESLKKIWWSSNSPIWWNVMWVANIIGIDVTSLGEVTQDRTVTNTLTGRRKFGHEGWCHVKTDRDRSYVTTCVGPPEAEKCKKRTSLQASNGTEPYQHFVFKLVEFSSMRHSSSAVSSHPVCHRVFCYGRLERLTYTPSFSDSAIHE